MDATTTPRSDGAAEVPGTMTAWSQRVYGGPEVVTAASAPVPEPREGELLLRMRVTALNSGDVRLMRGEPLLVRLFFGLRRPRIPVRGMDVAGTVVAVGTGDVGGFAVGEVSAGLAEYVRVPAARVVRRPEGVSPADAACVPIAAGTAWQALERAGVGEGNAEGKRVLVIGASGGVGTFAVQLATEGGAEVWALTGERTRELVAGLGATRTFDYRTCDHATDLPRGEFDAVVCVESAAPLRTLQALVRAGGVLVMVSGAGGRVLGPIGRMLRAGLLSVGSRRPIRSLAATTDTRITARLLELVASGGIRPVIERTYALSEARAALAHVDGGHTVGKVVVVA